MGKILFFGDVVGKPARRALAKELPKIRQELEPDLVVANVENLAHGKGVTVSTIKELDALGIDAYTSGNHVFDKGELSTQAFESHANIIRPANYIGNFPGRGFTRIQKGGQSYLLINLNATVFFEKQFWGEIGSPFREFDRIMADVYKEGDIVFVDFHSEATSEKRAFGFYADGRANLVVGTHTHVPTADLQILPKGTGYVSDVGMVGPLNSVLGVPIENSWQLFLGGKFVYDVEERGPVMINGVYAQIENGSVISIQKIYREINL